MPSEHSTTIGGSSAGRVLACPGSVVLCQEAPKQTSSIYAQTGTALHDCMEALVDPSMTLKQIRVDAAGDFAGQVVKGVEITDKLVDHKLKPAVRWFKETLAPHTWTLEEKCAFPQIPGAFGTVDVIYRKKGDVGVADWKFGDGKPVALKNNAQIMFYMFAAIHTLPSWFEGYTAYTGHIFQPFYNPAMEKWQEETFPLAKLLDFKKDLQGAWELSRRNNPVLEIGDHCDWCAAKSICPKIRDVAAGILEPREGERTAEDYAADLAKASALESLVKELRKSAADFVRKGGSIEGWKLVNEYSNRFFVGDQHVVETDLRERGLRVKDIYPKTLPTPAAIERTLKGRGLATDISDLTDRKIKGDKLVPNSAKGKPKISRAALLKRMAAIGKARRLQK